jgi:hypothetical protein
VQYNMTGWMMKLFGNFIDMADVERPPLKTKFS